MKKYVIGNDYTMYSQYYADGNARIVITENTDNSPVGTTVEVTNTEVENVLNNAEVVITFESPKSVLNIGKHLLKFLKEVYPDEFKND